MGEADREKQRSGLAGYVRHLPALSAIRLDCLCITMWKTSPRRGELGTSAPKLRLLNHTEGAS